MCGTDNLRNLTGETEMTRNTAGNVVMGVIVVCGLLCLAAAAIGGAPWYVVLPPLASYWLMWTTSTNDD